MPSCPSCPSCPSHPSFAAALRRGAFLLGASLAISPLVSARMLQTQTADTQPALVRTADAGRSTRPLSGEQLVQRLRAGGCVLVMRHASAPGMPDARTAEPDNPHHERQLDAAGKASARELGVALRTLRIPIGPIYTSPTYRARETIRLTGLGAPEVVAQLAESKRGMSGAADRSQVEWLRRAANQAPPAGRDTLIVTHTPNIVGAFGRGVADIMAGEALIFEPQGSEHPRLLGRMTVAEWSRLARAR